MKRIKKVFKVLSIFLGTLFLVCFIIGLFPVTRAYANGWIIEANDVVAEFTKHPIMNYSLDFYVDTSWQWLPWKWDDGIMSAVYYMLYLLANMFWMLNALMSYFVGYIVEQAFTLDFVSTTISQLSKNIQTIAGIDSGGLKSEGLFPMLLPFGIVITGAYIAYMGVYKRKLSTALSKALTFLLVTIFSMGFVAYSNNYLTKINGFSTEFNTEILNIGNKISAGEDETVLAPEVRLRDTLFKIQVTQPYTILQYGDSTVDNERLEKILSVDPLSNDDSRSKAVENEVKEGNTNMGFQNAGNRLGMTLMILVINLTISFVVLSLVALKLFADVMFIVYATFLPVALAFGMFPGTERIVRMGFMKMFNALLNKSGITLILTVACSISQLLYNTTVNKGFMLMAFVQIVVWIGIKYKSNELLGYMSLNNNDSKQVSQGLGQTARKVTRTIGANTRRVRHNRMLGALTKGENRNTSNTNGGSVSPSRGSNNPMKNNVGRKNAEKTNEQDLKRKPTSYKPRNEAERVGTKLGRIASIKDNVGKKFDSVKDGVKNAPVNGKYAVNRMKSTAKQTVNSVRTGADMEKLTAQKQRVKARKERSQQVSAKSREMRVGVLNRKQEIMTQRMHPTQRVTPSGVIQKSAQVSSGLKRDRLAKVSPKEKRVTSRNRGKTGGR